MRERIKEIIDCVGGEDVRKGWREGKRKIKLQSKQK